MLLLRTASGWLAVNHHRRWDAVATNRVRRLQPRAGRIRPISTRSSWLAVNHHRRWDAVATHRVRRLQPRAGRIRPISTRSSWLAVRRSTWSARTRSVPRRSALASSVAQAAAVELLLLDPVQTSNESRSASSSFTASTAHRHWSRRLSRAAEWWQAGAAGRLKARAFYNSGRVNTIAHDSNPGLGTMGREASGTSGF